MTDDTSEITDISNENEKVDEALVEHINIIMNLREKILNSSAVLCENEERTHNIKLDVEDFKLLWYSSGARIAATIAKGILDKVSLKEEEIKKFLQEYIEDTLHSFNLLLMAEMGNLLIDYGYIEDPTTLSEEPESEDIQTETD